MRTFNIIIIVGLIALIGGVGIRYSLESGKAVPVNGQASVISTVLEDANIPHCGEAIMSEKGVLSDQQPYMCFARHLQECSPADFIAVIDSGNIKYSRTIKELRDGQCFVKESYTAVAKKDLIGKSMLCAYDPKLPLSQEINYRNCTGELRDELFNRLPQ